MLFIWSIRAHCIELYKAQAMLKLRTREWLSEHICCILLSGNFAQSHYPPFYNVPHKMQPHIYMIGPFMKCLMFTKWMELWLSHWTVTTFCEIPSSFMIPLSHIASFTASVIGMYSASVVDKATTNSRTALQLIAIPYKVKTYLVRDFLVSILPA